MVLWTYDKIGVMNKDIVLWTDSLEAIIVFYLLLICPFILNDVIDG